MQSISNTQTFLFSEQDIRLFLQPRPTKRKMKGQLWYGVGLLGFVLAGYGVLNYNALLRIYTPIEPVSAQTIATPAPTPVVLPGQTPAPAVATPAPLPTIPANTVGISSLGISAPIFWDTEYNEKIMQDKLRNGVLHLGGTAKPGQKGVVVITGHSSNYPWIKGAYNTIFAPLHKTKAGETIVINYDNQEYAYKITKTYKVSPTELSVLKGGGDGTLRLITCTPIGTSLRRLVVEAEQVSPNPAENQPFTNTVLTDSIPGLR